MRKKVKKKKKNNKKKNNNNKKKNYTRCDLYAIHMYVTLKTYFYL